MTRTALLEIEDLRVTFTTTESPVQAVRGVNVRLGPGATVAVLGESGSGKSVTGKAILGLLRPPSAHVSGSIKLQGNEIIGRDDKQMASIRGVGVGMVFQDALDGLNPVFSIGSQIEEILRVRGGADRGEARAEAIRLLSLVGISNPEQRLRAYPHQFSGGMRQRVCIAMAIALKPALLIADEPTTALDVTVQAEILELINQLRADTGMGLLFVTHDLSVAKSVADRVIVMYAGRIVEQGAIDEVFQRPTHPYTKALLQSHPAAVAHWSELRPIGGAPPSKSNEIVGCPFHPRCPMVQERCREEAPVLTEVAQGRLSACHFALEVSGV